MGMAYETKTAPFTMTAGEDLSADRLVLNSSGEAMLADAGEAPVGITCNAVEDGESVAVQPITGGVFRVTAAGAISAGDDLYAANDGKVSTSAVGTQIGIAITAATGDGGKLSAHIWPIIGGAVPYVAKGKNYHEFFDHFDWGVTEDGNKFSESADKGIWLKSSTDGDTDGKDVCKVADDGPGGILQLTCNDADADNENLQMNGEAFKLQTGKKLRFETRLAVLDVDKCDLFVGLAVADVDILGGVTDRVGFQNDHDGNIDALVEQDNTESASDTGKDLADCAAIANFAAKSVVLAFYWDGAGSVYFFVDGELVVTKTDNGTTIVIPDDEAMSPVIQIRTHTGAGAVQTVWVDYLHIWQEL